MVTTSKISQQGMQIIYTFISCLTDNEDLAPKTLKEYTGDLKHFVSWFEFSEHQEDNIIFDIADIATPITKYRDVMQKKFQLKAANVHQSTADYFKTFF